MRREQQESLDRGINLFNEGRYFEAHEEWEHEWRLMTEGEDKDFFQGLIMAAASLYHYDQRECHGFEEMLKRSVACLRPGRDAHADIDVGALIADLERLRRRSESCSFSLAPGELPIIHRSLVNW